MAQLKTESPKALSHIEGYGLAILSFCVALGVGLILQRYTPRNVGFPILLFGIAVTVWYGGTGPGVLALILSGFAFDFFFTQPYYSLFITVSDFPYYVLFVAFAVLITVFASVRRRVERELRQARDELEAEVEVRKRSEEEVRGLNKDLEKRTVELQAVNKELEAFAYSTSHDLRAPLRHIAGYAELLQKSVSSSLDGKSQEYMGMILDSAQRMGHLIDDLLAFSRIGRAETRNTWVSLKDVVTGILKEMQQEIDGRNIVWKIETLPDIYGDPSMLKVVLTNLISNAIKFTRTRSQAEIEIGYADGTGGEVVVFIRDNGVGFNMKYVNKLFGVFQRLHRVQTFEGTGIGLATVQRIIHRHGGRVWAEGQVDKGATFYFSAPKSRSVVLG